MYHLRNIFLMLLFFSFNVNLFAQDTLMFISEPINLGATVNSMYSEAEPKISPDGKYLYFCRRANPENVGSGDIWVAQKLENGEWQQAQNPGKPLNDEKWNQVVAVHSDGNKLLINGRYLEHAESHLYIAQRTADGWANPKNISFKDFIEDGTSYGATTDFKVIIIAAHWEGGIGDDDLYISFQINDTLWSKPKNLGKTINTIGSEVYPTLAPDGKTLYFSSTGFDGLGDYDLFMTKRLDDTWLNWSTPENMGELINTVNYDADFTTDAQANYAYISCNKNLGMNFDIFKVQLPQEKKPTQMVVIMGIITDKETGAPLETTINYYDMATWNLLGTISSSASSGEYSLVLDMDKAYAIEVEKTGYHRDERNFDFRNITEYRQTIQNFELAKVDKNLPDGIVVYFDVGSAIPNNFDVMNRLVNYLKSNDKTVTIKGHTDDVGNENSNWQLSMDRAKAIENFLLSNGIDGWRIEIHAEGESIPFASNNTEAGRAENRRVTIYVND